MLSEISEQVESSGKLLSETSIARSDKPSTQKSSQPKAHSTLLDQFEERWIDFNGPVAASVAMVKSILVIGHLQSHDPILLHRSTGYPLRFTRLLVSGLLQSTLWMTSEYEIMVCNIEDSPENKENIDDLLRSVMEQLWHDPALDFPKLEYEWSTCMGIPGWTS